MNGFLRQSTASQVRTIGAFVDDTDFKTLENALTIANTDILIKKNGAASAAKNSGGATADGSGGMYHLTWDATDTATVGELFYSVKVAGSLVVFGSYTILEEAVYDAEFAASAAGYLQPTTAGRTLDVSATGEAGLDWANIGSPTTAVNLSATNIDVDQVVASVSGAVGSVTGAVGSVTGAVGSVAAGGITAASFAAGAIDASAIAADAIGSSELAASAVTEIQAAVAAGAVASVTGSVGSIAAGGITAASFAAGAIDASAIAADAIGSSELAASAVTEIQTAVAAGSVASVTGAVGSVTGNVGGNVTGSVGSLATQAKADVNAEVVDALATDTYAESSAVPAATASLALKIRWLATLARNKITQTSTTQTLRNDADSGTIATSTVSDNGTTFTRGEWT